MKYLIYCTSGKYLCGSTDFCMKNPSYKRLVKNIIHDIKKSGFIYNPGYSDLGKKQHREQTLDRIKVTFYNMLFLSIILFQNTDVFSDTKN